MNELWFEPSYSWVPGTLFGVTCGIWGASVGFLARRGQAKTLVLTITGLFLAVASALFIAGLFAFLVGQPYPIWYGLGLAGIIGLMVIGANSPVILYVYRNAERLRMKAIDASLGTR